MRFFDACRFYNFFHYLLFYRMSVYKHYKRLFSKRSNDFLFFKYYYYNNNALRGLTTTTCLSERPVNLSFVVGTRKTNHPNEKVNIQVDSFLRIGCVRFIRFILRAKYRFYVRSHHYVQCTS